MDSFPTIFIAEHDDPDVDAATIALKQSGIAVHWLKLGLDQSNYDLEISGDRTLIRCDGCEISTELVNVATRIVYRRWKVAPPFPIVTAEILGDVENFAAREWAAAFKIALQTWYTSSDFSVWSRNPIIETEKVSYLQLATVLGLLVPDFAISTRHRQVDWPLVSKGVGVDQAVVKGSRYATTRVVPEMHYLFDSRQPCPTLLQREIVVARELRVGYSFGFVAAVEQRRVAEDSPVDIRYAEVSRTAVEPDPSVIGEIRRFAKGSNLNVFSIDVLQDQDGLLWFVDVNPDGLFVAVDDERRTLTNTFVRGLNPTH